MTRKIDELGRIVIPVEMRSKLHLEKEDAVNIDCVNDQIILNKAKPCCIICRSADLKLSTVGEALICSECIEKVKTL